MPYGIGYDAATRTGGGRRGGVRGSLLDIPAQLLEAPAGIADRVAAVRSDNRAPGLRGALGAIADPQPILERDAFQQAREQAPQVFAEIEAAFAAGGPSAARQAVLRGIAPMVVQGGGLPAWAPGMMQSINAMEQQGFDPTAADAPEQAAGLGMRMGEKGSAVGRALGDIMGRRSEAQRRTDQTDMERERLPGLMDKDAAAAQASRAAAGSSSAMAELYRERAVTEEESRDPTIAKLRAEGERAEAEADMALQKAASWQEEFDANLARIRAGNKQTAAETRNTLGQARERARLEPARKAEIERRGQGGAGGALWEQLPDGPGMGAPTPAPTQQAPVAPPTQGAAQPTPAPQLIPQEQLTQTFPELFEMARTSQLSVKVAREHLRRRGVEDRASQDAILMSLDAYTGGGS